MSLLKKFSFNFPSNMQPMEKVEKEAIKHRYAAALYKALKDSPFDSFRSLALQCGIEPTHMQKISTGKVDVSTTTNIAIAQGLGISYSKFSNYYDKIVEDDIRDFDNYLQEKKSRRGKSAKSLRH